MAVDTLLTVEGRRKLRENELHDTAYTLLHEDHNETAGKGELNIEVVGAMEERGVNGEI
jgi:hypothetical protein